MLRYNSLPVSVKIVLAGNSDRETFVITIVCSIFYIKLKVCLLVCTLYKFTFLNQSQLNFAHVSPLGLEETVGYVWSENV